MPVSLSSAKWRTNKNPTSRYLYSLAAAVHWTSMVKVFEQVIHRFLFQVAMLTLMEVAKNGKNCRDAISMHFTPLWDEQTMDLLEKWVFKLSFIASGAQSDDWLISFPIQARFPRSDPSERSLWCQFFLRQLVNWNKAGNKYFDW